MAIPHDLTADLPPPRDDEPASLRQDIVDELADHLECALHRELLRGGASGPCETASDSPDSSFRPDPQADSLFRTAQHTVLTRFGNPAALARRLWLDAMKERLMAQKITILLASVATAAVVVLSGLMWLSLERSHEAQAALLQQHQQFSAGILQALESLRPTPVASTSVDGWSPLTLKLISEDGQPVQGEVKVWGSQFGGGDKTDINLQEATAADGTIDLGMIPYGNYTMRTTATAANESHTERIMIAPGRPSEQTVVCPTSPPPEVDLRFQFNPPDQLNAEDLVYLVIISAQPRRIADREWKSRDLHVLVDGSGRIKHQVISHDWNQQGYWLALAPAPRMHRYQFDVHNIMVCTPHQGTVPPASTVGTIQGDEFVLFGAKHNAVTAFEPQPGVENVWRIDLPASVWTAVTNSFLASPAARHAAIPEGMQLVEVPFPITELSHLTSDRRRQSVVGLRVDLRFWVPKSGVPIQSSWQTLLSGIELVEVGDIGAAARSARRLERDAGSIETTASLLMTAEQTAVVELARRKGRLSITVADNQDAPPRLDERVLEELRALPDAEPAKDADRTDETEPRS